MGIETTRLRMARNGGVIIEIPDPDNEEKANALRDRFQDILGNDAVINRLVARGTLRVVGFDDSVFKSDVVNGIAKINGCPIEDIKVTSIAPMCNGLNMTWVQCPLAMAIKMINERQKIQLGWSIARMELLGKRPMQCHKCWTYGHAQGVCRSTINRTGLCFKCGEGGHQASKCTSNAHCLPCQDIGKNSSHKMGSNMCKAMNRSNRNRKINENPSM